MDFELLFWKTITLLHQPSFLYSFFGYSIGITKNKIVTELFRISGGKPGYYLANFRDKKYYYCGDDWASVKLKLQELGIGRDEPN